MDPSPPNADVPASTAPTLHSIPEVAALLGLRVTWLQEKVRAGEVPYVQVGKVSVRFTDAQVAEIVERLSVKPRKDPKSLTTPRAKKRVA